MDIDLRVCEAGDILISDGGFRYRYITCHPNDELPHEMIELEVDWPLSERRADNGSFTRDEVSLWGTVYHIVKIVKLPGVDHEIKGIAQNL